MTDLRAIAEGARKEGGSWLGALWIAWSPDRALAALDVIEAAAKTCEYPRGERELYAMNALRAALDRWDAL